MIKKYLLFITIVAANNIDAQDRNSIWIFGDSAGIDFRNTSNPIPYSSGMDGRGSCVSISDTLGNLTLYAFDREGTDFWSTCIYNHNNDSVQGADSITGSAWYNEFVLLPKRDSGYIYYLFSIGSQTGVNQGLFATTIDMNLNGGLGAVTQENIQIDNNDLADCLTAVRHGNGRDWWLIDKLYASSHPTFNRFFVFSVTPDSIFPPIIQDLGNATDIFFQKIIWHPSYQKFMVVNTRGYMAEFNFDRCTGTISLNRNIYPEESGNYTRPFWEGAYSSSGNVLYVSRTSYGGNYGDYNYLLQYDLTAPDIPASSDTLDSTMYPPVDCGALRLAPDGKIYYSQAYISQSVWSYPYADTMRNSINENLGVINNPDVVGSGCNFAPFSFYLGGKRTYYGLPNNPNYSLGPLAGSPCDTLYVATGEVEKSAKCSISPNPATRIVYFNARHIKGKNGTLQIINAMGEKVFEKALPVYGGYSTHAINVSGYTSGIYFVSLQTEKEILSTKFVKQ